MPVARAVHTIESGYRLLDRGAENRPFQLPRNLDSLVVDFNDVEEVTLYNPPLVPDEFIIPELLETERMRLRPLTINDAVKDFAAVMESEERLRTIFEPGGDWPSGLTLEQNLIELGWHQTEFQVRTSFAFTVVSLDESEVLGCMYIYPTRKPGYDAEITMWVRQSRVGEGLDEHLYETVERWISDCWPLTNPGYPGRRISFEEWRALSPERSPRQPGG